MLLSDPSSITVTPVLADRADDFQRWLRTVVVPAARAHHPDVEGRWLVSRSAVTDDGVVPFVFLFTGDDPTVWDLRPLLEQAYGADAADRQMTAFLEMLKGEQVEWAAATVRFDHPRAEDLTAREIEVLQLVARGLTAQAVAHACRISVRTVHKHLENAYTTLGVHDRLSAVDLVRRWGLLP
jgi:DNA-binding CsgD family transcriptional regulator